MDLSKVIICSDYDGTLTRELKHGFDAVKERSVANICKENMDAVAYITSKGGRFIVASGRSAKKMDFLYEHLPIDDLFAGTNGTGLYSRAKKEFVLRHPMRIHPVEIVKKVLAKIPETASFHITDYEANVLVWENGQGDPVEFALQVDKALKIIFEDTRPEVLAKIEKLLNENFGDVCDVTQSCWHIVECNDLGAGKGDIIDYFKREFPDKTIVALGDYHNDIPMIKAADLSFCPANATEEVKKLCTATFRDSGEGFIADVAEYLEKL